MKIRYQPRWKEMLDGFFGDHKFTVEMTMGRIHVYFPTDKKWADTAPAWAKDLWPIARDQAAEWCEKNSIPFDIDIAAWVEFDE